MTTLRLAAAGLALAATLGGCRRERGEYANDTATAPAMKPDTSATRGVPDSTTGVGARTGRPGVSGDSSRRRTTPRP